MSKYTSWLISVMLLAAPISSMAATYWSPQIGIDYKYWGIDTKPTYDDIFPRLDNAFDVYIGTRINGFFGIDIGYEQSENKRITKVYEGGEVVFVQPELIYNSTMIDLQLHSLFCALNFYCEVARDLEIIFMMGVAKIYPLTHVMHLEGDQGVWFEYQNETIPFWSGRFGFGMQYNPLPCFGLKGSIVFDQTRRLNYVGVDQDDFFYSFLPYNKAVTFQAGIVYNFIPPRRCPRYN
jgi:hypothetical protein